MRLLQSQILRPSPRGKKPKPHFVILSIIKVFFPVLIFQKTCTFTQDKLIVEAFEFPATFFLHLQKNPGLLGGSQLPRGSMRGEWGTKQCTTHSLLNLGRLWVAHCSQIIRSTIFFIRDAFIRDEMMSTENFGKIRDGEYSNFSRYKG